MFRKKTIYCLLTATLLSASAGCETSASHPENLPNRISRIPGISSQQDIKLDVLATAGNRLHLVWQEQKRGIFYRYGAHPGESWSPPFRIAETAYYSLDFGPRIFASRDTLLVFWYNQGFNVRRSADHGLSWSEPSVFLSTEPLAKYSVCNSGRRLFLAYTNQTGLFFTRSNDFGDTWQKPQFIWRFEESATQHSPPYITARKDTVYLIWSQLFRSHQSPAGIAMQGKLFYVMSPNRGERWSAPIEIDAGRKEFGAAFATNHNLYLPSLQPLGEDLFVAYGERGLFGPWLKAGSGNPAPPEYFAQNPRGNFLIRHSNTTIFLLYSDNRYQEKEWWAHIPGHQMFTWDKNPYWVNNDLFLSIVQKGTERKEILLTPPLSYISGFRNVLAMEQFGEYLLLFWSGREKVGKRVDQYGFPVEIFYTKIMI